MTNILNKIKAFFIIAFAKTKDFFKKVFKRKNDSYEPSPAYFNVSGKKKIFYWVLSAFFILYGLTLIYPILFMFINSFKTQQAYAESFYGLSWGLEFANYSAALTTETYGYTLIDMFFYSLVIVTLSTFATVFFSSCSAYIMAKYQFKGKSIIYSIVIFAMILPIVGTMPAMVKVFRTMGLYDTPIALVFIWSGAFGSNFLLLYSFFKNISWGYAEAAMIDGAGDFKIFLKIMLPIALPAVTSVAVLTWIGIWNEYVLPAVFLPSTPLIAVGINYITETLKGEPVKMYAAVVLTLIPIITVFLVFQKTIMTNTVAGGLKG